MIDTSNVPQRKNYNEFKKKIASVFSNPKSKTKKNTIKKDTDKISSVFKEK